VAERGERLMTTRRRRAKDEAGLRGRARELLRELGVRPPLVIEDFGRRFGEADGRPILFRPYGIPVPGPFVVTGSIPMRTS
jgi:hypothetical protein